VAAKVNPDRGLGCGDSLHWRDLLAEAVRALADEGVLRERVGRDGLCKDCQFRSQCWVWR
jgi:hypothetical protein